MPKYDFSALRMRLIQGGISPKHVGRILTELKDHFDDLKREGIDRGQSAADAEREAMARLGSEDAIVEGALGKPELQSWAARWPWAIYGLAPAVTLTAFVTALIFLIFGIGTGLKSIGVLTQETRHLTPFWLSTSFDVLFLSIMYVVPLLIAAYVCQLVVIRRAHLGWPLTGLFLLCLFGAALDISAIWPRAPEAYGAIELTFALAPPFPNRVETAIRALINIGLVAALLQWLRQKHAVH